MHSSDVCPLPCSRGTLSEQLINGSTYDVELYFTLELRPCLTLQHLTYDALILNVVPVKTRCLAQSM